MKRNNPAFIIIIILIAVNLGTLAFFWFLPESTKETRRNRLQERVERPRKEIVQFLDKQLDLSDEQKKKFEVLRQDFFKQSGEIRQEIRAARRQFYALASSPDTDEAVVEEQAGVVARKQKELEMATFYHFRSLRKELTPVQQPKFDELMEDLIDARRINGTRKRKN